jgi:hypothetical protein
VDATREDLRRSLEARAYALDRGAPEQVRKAKVNRLVYRITESRAEAFHRRLTALMEDFEEADIDEASGVDEAETHVYAFMAAFYPRFDYAEVEAAGRSNAYYWRRYPARWPIAGTAA